jgi:cytochrome c oxidase subunit 3
VEQQAETASFGMWLFLLTEIMFFGGLFMAYLLYRNWYYDAFVAAAIRSASRWERGQYRGPYHCPASPWPWASMGGGDPQPQGLLLYLAIFTIHASAWSFLASSGRVSREIRRTPHPRGKLQMCRLCPSAHRQEGCSLLAPDMAQNAQLFFFLYFAMTGMHALHMIIGIVLLGILMARTQRGDFTTGHVAQIENFGLYWHFVDIVWIFLFPLLYLINLHGPR